jgi:hypothetical protein
MGQNPLFESRQEWISIMGVKASKATENMGYSDVVDAWLNFQAIWSGKQFSLLHT